MHKPILIVLLFKVAFFGLLKDSWTQSSISYSYRITVFLRGAGGFSTSSPPFSYSERKSQLNLTPLSKSSVPAQELPPDIVIEEQTHPSQVCILKPNWDSCAAPVEFQDHPPQQLQLCVCCNSTILLGGLLDSSFLLLEILCFVFPVHIHCYIIVSFTNFSVLLSFGFLTSCFCFCTQTLFHWHQLKLIWNMQNLFSQFAFFFRTWQALLYRLSGDYNPLHSDPSYAKAAGYGFSFHFCNSFSCGLVCQNSHTVYWMPVMANWAEIFWLKSFCLDDKSRKSFKLCMCAKKSYHVSQIQQVKTLIRSIARQ